MRYALPDGSPSETQCTLSFLSLSTTKIIRITGRLRAVTGLAWLSRIYTNTRAQFLQKNRNDSEVVFGYTYDHLSVPFDAINICS